MKSAVHTGGMLRSKLNVSKQGGYIYCGKGNEPIHIAKKILYTYIYIYSFMQVAIHPSSQRYLHTVVYVIEGSTHITRRQSNSGCSQACFCTSGNREAAAACACSYSSAGRTLECRLQRAASWSEIWPEHWPWAWEELWPWAWDELWPWAEFWP